MNSCDLPNEQWTPVNPCIDCKNKVDGCQCEESIEYSSKLDAYESLLTLLFNSSPIVIPQTLKLKEYKDSSITVTYKFKETGYLVHYDIKEMLKTIKEIKENLIITLGKK